MRRFACFLGVVAAIPIWASQAFALGADYSPQALRERVGPIGGQTPVHGYWVNWEDVFFYAGDVKAFNQFIEAYGSLERCKHKVVIHPGNKLAASPWDKTPRDIAVDWSLYVWNTGQPLGGKVLGQAPGEQQAETAAVDAAAPTRVDVWVGPRLKLQDLLIPDALEVYAGEDAAQDRAIQDFVAARKTRPAAVSGEFTAGKSGCKLAPLGIDADALVRYELTAGKSGRGFVLSVELSDGSRLRGEANGIKELPLQTTFGKLSIALGPIESIEFLDHDKTAKVHFRNGDQLTGVVNLADWGDFQLRTLVGEVTIPARSMRSCKIEAAPSAEE